MTTAEASVDAFEEHRGLLCSVAYRMLGSVGEAEDMVQEAWLRWRAADEAAVRSPRAFLVTVVTRLCLDQLRSARVRREQYVGPWLPEPILTARVAAGPSAEDELERRETLSLAFLVVLERLAPMERAVFLLHDVFDYGYGEVADIVGRNEPACRQILRRARERMRERRARFNCGYDQRLRLTYEFLRATGEGDLDGLVGLLAQDITSWSDGGGKASAATRPVHGADHVARLYIGLSRKSWFDRLEVVEVNGVPGVAAWSRGCLINVLVIEPGPHGITDLLQMRNPEKLERFGHALLATRAAGPHAFIDMDLRTGSLA